MARFLQGLFRWATKKRVDVLAKGAIFASSVAGIWIAVPDVYGKIVANSVSLGIALIGLRYISKFSVPQAFAIAYFRSFVKPVGEALATGGGQLEYKDPVSGTPTEIPLNRNVVDAQLKIVLPGDLSLGATASGVGLQERQNALNSKTVGDLRVNTRKRPFTVHFELTKGPGVRQLVMFDVPNTLNPLRDIQFEDEPDSSRRVERGKRALGEFSEELRKNLSRFKADIGNVAVS